MRREVRKRVEESLERRGCTIVRGGTLALRGAHLFSEGAHAWRRTCV
jgi:hypothetical protein